MPEKYMPPLSSRNVTTDVLSAKCSVCGYIMNAPKDKIRYVPSVWICRNCFKKHIISKLNDEIKGNECLIASESKELHELIERRDKIESDEIEIDEEY